MKLTIGIIRNLSYTWKAPWQLLNFPYSVAPKSIKVSRKEKGRRWSNCSPLHSFIHPLPVSCFRPCSCPTHIAGSRPPSPSGRKPSLPIDLLTGVVGHHTLNPYFIYYQPGANSGPNSVQSSLHASACLPTFDFPPVFFTLLYLSCSFVWSRSDSRLFQSGRESEKTAPAED